MIFRQLHAVKAGWGAIKREIMREELVIITNSTNSGIGFLERQTMSKSIPTIFFMQLGCILVALNKEEYRSTDKRIAKNHSENFVNAGKVSDLIVLIICVQQ